MNREGYSVLKARFKSLDEPALLEQVASFELHLGHVAAAERLAARAEALRAEAQA